MKHRVYIIACLLLSLLLSAACDKESPLPNVIFILADDLGWSQTSAYGSAYYHTPTSTACRRRGSASQRLMLPVQSVLQPGLPS